jgi:hypothetical protein
MKSKGSFYCLQHFPLVCPLSHINALYTRRNLPWRFILILQSILSLPSENGFLLSCLLSKMFYTLLACSEPIFATWHLLCENRWSFLFWKYIFTTAFCKHVIVIAIIIYWSFIVSLTLLSHQANEVYKCWFYLSKLRHEPLPWMRSPSLQAWLYYERYIAALQTIHCYFQDNKFSTFR